MVEPAVGDHVAASAGAGLLEGAAEIGGGERAGAERGPEVDLLEHGVDDGARGGVDQEDVVEAEPLLQAAEKRMRGGVRLRIARAVLGVVEPLLAAEGIFIAADVMLLQHGGVVVERIDEHRGVGGRAGAAAALAAELVGVEAGQFTAGCRDRLGVGLRVGRRRAEAPAKLHERLGGHAVLRDQVELVVKRVEVALDRLGRDGVDRVELVEGMRLQRRGGGPIGRKPHQCQRNERHRQQREQEPVAEKRQPAGRRSGGRCGP